MKALGISTFSQCAVCRNAIAAVTEQRAISRPKIIHGLFFLFIYLFLDKNVGASLGEMESFHLSFLNGR